MVIEQSLKLLNAPSFGSENIPMLSIRQSYKIDRPIISPNSVQVVDNPAIRKGFIVSLLPDQNMLTDITSFICSWMLRQKYLNISSYLTPSAFIYCISNSPLTRTNSYFIGTRLAMLRPVINQLTTRTKLPMPQATFFALLQLLLTMRMIILAVIFFRIHILIVTQKAIIYKE